jgi:uncharacterized protein
MIMRSPFLALLLTLTTVASAQTSYKDSLSAFQKNYVQTHEVVTGEDKKAMQFYPVDKRYQVVAKFSEPADSKWISFPTSGTLTKVFKVYGILDFQLRGKPLQLRVYQSQDLLLNPDYKNYLFLPFTDSTTGNETYEGGRYIDLATTDIHDGLVVIDFNKTYNPYCAYVSGKYNCPIPPKENSLPVAIRAGEKAYQKAH